MFVIKMELDKSDKGWMDFHYYAKDSEYPLINDLVKQGSNIHLKTNDGMNCLHIAAQNGHLSLCKTLINTHNFDVNMTDNDGFTALHFSVQNGSYKLFDFLTDKVADLHMKTKSGENCLHIAARNGNLKLCRKLVNKHNFDVQVADKCGITPLHFSALSGSLKLINYFATKGTDIYQKTKNGLNCLHIAAEYGHLKLCRTLVDKYNFNLNITENNGWASLHFSALNGSNELVKCFTDMGADIHLKTSDGMNCLHIASLKGHLELCKTLISRHHFDGHMTDNLGRASFHFSAQNGSYEIIKFFANKGTDIHPKTNTGSNCLHIAARHGHLNLCRKLVYEFKFDTQIMDDDGFTALHRSVQNGNYELVKFFIDEGTDIHLKTFIGHNCLHIAAINGHFNLCKILIRKHKFDVKITGNNGITALHCAITNGSYELVKFFIDKGSDLFLKTKDGMNCLHIAAFNGNLNLCKTLINKHKFKMNMMDNLGLTEFHWSVYSSNYELFKFFAGKVSDIYLKTRSGMNCLHIAAFFNHLNLCKTLVNEHNFVVDSSDNGGWTSLHICVKSGNSELFNFFIGRGANIHLKTNDGKNCLHIASLNGHLNLCKVFLNEYKFNINMRDNDGCTPLHCSASNGSFELFSYLLEKGSEIYCKTRKMKNVLHLSAVNGHFDICKFVLDFFVKDYVNNNTKKQYSKLGKSYRSQIFYKYNTIFLHAMDTDGNTYLHLAADGNQSKVCEILLKYDSEIIFLLNKKDESARDIAMKNGYKDVLKALKVEYDRAGMFSLLSCC